MSLKLLVPAIGIVGAIGGIIGASSSIFGKEEAKVTPDNSRRVPTIGPLLIYLKCSPDPDRWINDKDSYVFNILGSVGESNLVKMQEKIPVDISVNFEILSGSKKDAIKQFSDKKANKIFATIQYWNQGGLNVNLGDLSGGEDRYIGSQQFWCKGEDTQISWLDASTGDRIIGYSDMKTLNEDKLVGSLNGIGKMKLVVDNCAKENNREQRNTCDLILTDKDSIKWRIKFSEVAKLTSAQ